jgi:nitrate reductase NapAB chaperone NapD
MALDYTHWSGWTRRRITGTPRFSWGFMHYSGILVITEANETAGCAADLGALPGVEVHFCYPESGRIILVQETDTVEAQEEGFRRIQALPRVRMAALVEHRVDPESAPLNP